MSSRNILILGDTGQGKTHAISYLDRNRYAIINAENQILPFRKNRFKYYLEPKTLGELESAMIACQKMAEAGNIDGIVIDSFYAVQEFILTLCESKLSGFEVYGMYAKRCKMFIKQTTQLGVPVILTCHPSSSDTGEDATHQRHCTVFGKVLQGKIDREFNIIGYTYIHNSVLSDEELDSQKDSGMPFSDRKNDYYFRFRTLGNDTAKAPVGMFDDYEGNNMQVLFDKMKAYDDE